jgi:hypothetical protein
MHAFCPVLPPSALAVMVQVCVRSLLSLFSNGFPENMVVISAAVSIPP